MMYLRIPSHVVVDFDFARFADHVLDQSPVYATRSLLRLGMQARDAIATATGGIAELSDEVGKLFQQACDAAPVPRLVAFDKSRPESEPTPIPATVYEVFYAAVEGMTAERPTDAPA